MMPKKSSAKKIIVNKKIPLGNKLKRNDSNDECSSSSSSVRMTVSTAATPSWTATSVMSTNCFLALVIATVCAICYSNSVQCGFVFDDISAIRDNRDLRPYSPWKNIFLNDFWGTPIQKEQSHKSYRPLCVLTFRWNYLLHGLEPFGYHLVNVLLHCIASSIYFNMCTMLLSKTVSFTAALLFAVHPIHTEAVTGVVGRAETLSSVFFLSAFIFYCKAAHKPRATGWRHLFMAMLCIALAMFSKEQGITVAGVCVVYEIFVVQKIRRIDISHMIRCLLSGRSLSLKTGTWTAAATKRLFILCLTTFLLLLVRLQIMGSKLPIFTRFDNPASAASTPSRQLTYNYLASLNLWLLLFPCNLCCDWTMGTVPLIEHFTDVRNYAVIAMYAILGHVSWHAFSSRNYKHSAVILVGLALMILPYIPASNLFFPVGFVIAERVLYMPSMGFCLLTAYGFHLLTQRVNGKICWLFMAILLGAYAAKTYHRNLDWANEYSIFMSGLQVNQRNAKLYNNVGHALEGENRYEEALTYFLAAVDVQPDDVGAHINVGRTYTHLEMYGEAEEAYLKAKSFLPKAKPGESYQTRIPPNYLNVFLNLANLIAKNRTRLEEADMLYRQAISMRSDYIQAYLNRADVLIKMNRTKEAQQVYERALLYDSNNPDIYYNLGVVLLEQGMESQAMACFDKALELNPEHEPALLNSAILLQETGQPELRQKVRQNLMALLAKNDSDERAHFNLGMLAMDEENVDEAEHWFRRAIHVKQDFRGALFNLALLLSDNNRPLDAEPVLNQLIAHHPEHTKGLILLGDIYVNFIKNLDAAEACYDKIIKLEPDNVQALHNLCVVYVERGKLIAAEDCLKHVVRIAPHQEYISRHLQYVQTRINNLAAGSEEKRLAFGPYDRRKFVVTQNRVPTTAASRDNSQQMGESGRRKLSAAVSPTVPVEKPSALEKLPSITDAQYHRSTTKAVLDAEQSAFVAAASSKSSSALKYDRDHHMDKENSNPPSRSMNNPANRASAAHRNIGLDNHKSDNGLSEDSINSELNFVHDLDDPSSDEQKYFGKIDD